MKKVLILASLLLLLPSSVFSQETIPLSIRPVKKSIVLEKVQSQILNISIFNKSSSALTGKLKALDFVVRGSQGIPVLLDQPLSADLGAQSWISLPQEEIVIEPGKEHDTVFTVTVPAYAKAGGHYAAIVFEPTLSSSEGASNISVRLASLLLIKVPGTVTESALISSFVLPQFVESGPVKLDFTIANTGDYHIVPKGEIIFLDVFGGEIDRQTIQEVNIFPSASRSYTSRVAKSFLLGPYRVQAKLTYGEGKKLGKNQWVLVFPFRLFLIVFIGLAILYYMVKTASGKKSLPSFQRTRSGNLSRLKERLKKRDD